jgi:hypothetical protein
VELVLFLEHEQQGYHPMKTVDEVASRLEGANTFSILDAKKYGGRSRFVEFTKT